MGARINLAAVAVVAGLSGAIEATAADVCDPQEVAKLLAEDGAANDIFALSIGIDGDAAAVGSLRDDDNGIDSGSAYVFVRGELGDWSQQAKLLPLDGEAGDTFGRSIAISGDTVAVGANDEDEAGFDAGAAYVFVRDELGEWTQQAKLTAADGSHGDWLGWTIDIDGDTIIVSAPNDDDHGEDSGSAYIFVRDELGDWSQQAKLTAADGAAEDSFAHAVAIHGDTAIVGAYQDDDLGTDSGSVYVFVRDELGDWSQQAKLTASDGNMGYHFGRFLDFDGQTALIGSPFYWPLNWGAAYFFVREGDDWIEQAKVLAEVPTTQEWFGSAVAVQGDVALIAPFFIFGDDPGRVDVFTRSGGEWTQANTLLASDGADGDAFGRAVGLSGQTAIVGADNDDDNGPDAGAAYIFEVRCGPDPCDADLTGDFVTDIADLLALLGAWGTPEGDVDGDGQTDMRDLNVLLAVWGGYCVEAANDTCATAPALFEGEHEFIMPIATTEGPAEPGCAPFERDVWFKLLVSCEGTVSVDLCGSNFTGSLAVYTACPAGPDEALACTGDGCAAPLEFAAVPGIYRLRLGEGRLGEHVVMTINCAPVAD
jgi:hypothetical protein